MTPHRLITWWLLTLLFGLLGHRVFGGVYTNVTLVFDYPTNELSTNLTFKLY